jgi:hypothetical protein
MFTLSITNTNMLKHIKTDLQSNRHFIATRGHMVSFLMMALMVTTWVNVFQDSVNAAAISTYL